MIESAEEFVHLRNSEIKAEYDRAAQEPASEDVWRDVICRYPEMRKWVAHNKTIPLAIVELLASDPDPRVREMIAMKRSASASVLLKLAQDRSPGVRQAVATNAKAPPEVLHQLASDSDEDVANAARERLQVK